VVKLYGSYNSRYFACLTPTEVRLYRGIAAGGGFSHSNEAQMAFARAMDASLGLDLVRVGNQGDLYFLGKKGLFRLRNDRQARLEIVNDALCSLARGEEQGRLGQVMVDADGRQVFYEVVMPESGIKDRFRKLLGGKSGGDSSLAHQVVYFNAANPRPINFPPTVIDTRREYGFRWNISPSGRFLVQARPDKKSYHLDVIDVTDESIIADFQMALAPIHELWVNDAGVMMVDVRQVGEEKLILALPDGVTRHSFCPPPSYRVLSLGPLHVSVMLESQRHLQIYQYNGKLVTDVDIQPLRQLGVEASFCFNDRGQIDVLCWQSGALHLQHADIKSIAVDAKRWDLSARQQQTDREQSMIHEATASHLQERKRLEDFQLSRQLLDAVQGDQPGNLPRQGSLPVTPSPLPAPIPSFSTEPPMATPAAAYPASGPLPETPPWMAGISQAPSNLPIPPAPPASSGVLPPPTPSSVLPPPAPISPVPSQPVSAPLPGPRPPIDRNAPPPLPARPTGLPPAGPPAPLPFLQSNSMMPPPDTEHDDQPGVAPPARPQPAAPPPAAVPAPSPPTPSPYASLAEVDAELESLRMTYIAGEVSREVYYSRRAELEGIRKSLQGIGSAGGAGPKRLDLDLGSPGEAPSSRLRPDPGLSGGLPLPGQE